MGLKPDFRIIANNSDITETIKQRFVRLTLTDDAGLESDKLDIVLADHIPDKPIELPNTGAELELYLGYDDVAQRMGLFIVDELELSGPPNQLTIKAKATPQDSTPTGKTILATQKTRSWPWGTPLVSVVATIAGEHSLESAVSAELSTITLPHIDQLNESDMNLLTRIAKDYDAIAKPAGGKLVMAKRATAKSTSGKSLESVTINQEDVTNWRMTISKREPAGSVVAIYRDIETSEDKEITVGAGEPVRRLMYHYSDEASATAAATSEFEKSNRAERKLTINLPGDNRLIAESKVQLSGFRPWVDGEYLITKATHKLDSSGYKCSITCENV